MSQHCEIVVTSRECVELLPCSSPQENLAADEVRGRTLCSLISPGTELAYCYQGESFPARPGYASVFEIEDVGDHVHDLKPGDRAFVMAPHRSWQRARRSDVVAVPKELAPEIAVWARLMNIAMCALTTTGARPPGRVLVTGLGPIGHLAAQVFSACGYEVCAVDPSPQRRALLERWNMAQVRGSVPEGKSLWQDQTALALECSGFESAVLAASRLVSRGGEVVLCGVPWSRRCDIWAQELLSVVFHRYVVLRSGWEWEVPFHACEFRHGSIVANLAAGMEWLGQGRIRVDDLAKICSPHEAPDVYRVLAKGQTDFLTFIFDWTKYKS